MTLGHQDTCQSKRTASGSSLIIHYSSWFSLATNEPLLLGDWRYRSSLISHRIDAFQRSCFILSNTRMDFTLHCFSERRRVDHCFGFHLKALHLSCLLLRRRLSRHEQSSICFAKLLQSSISDLGKKYQGY